MTTYFTRPVRARLGLLAISGSGLLWGTTGIGVHIVAERTGLPAVSIGWIRVLVASAFVLVISRGALIRDGWAAFRRHPVAVPVCGAGFGAYQALYFIGVQDVGVSVSTLVSLSVAPIVLTAASAIERRRRPSRSSMMVLICAVVGLALVCVRPSPGAAPHPLIGVLASIASGVGYAVITLVSRSMSDVAPMLLTGVTSVIGTVILLPFALVAGLHVPKDEIAAGWLLYIGVVPTVVAYWLFYRGLRTVSSEVAGVLTLLEPLTAAVLATAVLHESLSTLGVVGAVLMLGAVASLYLRRPEPPLPDIPPP